MTAMNARLSAMMFLQFFVWGAWYVTVGIYMNALGMGSEVWWAYAVSPVAGILSPFFLGMVADRYFPTEKVLGVLHIAGAIPMIAAPIAAAQGSSTLFVVLLLAHMLCYMPTLGLSNSLAFRNIGDQEKEFPLIRVFGTLGWIAAGILVSRLLQADATAIPLYTAGAAALALGFYSFTLPHTPPSGAGERPTVRSILGLDALVALKSPSFIVFILSSFLISIPLAAYYAYAPVFVNSLGLDNPGFKMSFGQMSEVAFMLVMPLFFARLGVKWMLVVGMGAWVLRYSLFAGAAAPGGSEWLVLAGIVLHGVCYDFFFVTGQIYVDKKSTDAIRGQAQGFLVLATYGIGMLIGTIVSGRVYDAMVADPAVLTSWRTFWMVPAAFAGAIMLFFAMAFRERLDGNVGASDV
jgi:nucleoside transporter